MSSLHCRNFGRKGRNEGVEVLLVKMILVWMRTEDGVSCRRISSLSTCTEKIDTSTGCKLVHSMYKITARRSLLDG